uniref:Exocyst complex component n=1 Tax=Spongospora subterranea TaxID=70186 RepID=A0A0H5RQY3_9EUKA|eukprot:CRZ11129.1 hypothetical protein [Spongospora subterranea]
MEAGEPASDATVLVGLVEAGGPVSTSIKAVLDRSMFATYDTCIRAHIRQKDGLIARLCSSHYQEFIDSIDSLVTVKADIRALDDRIQQVNGELQESGKDLIEVATRQLAWRITSQALSKAKRSVTICIRALEQIGKAQVAVSQGQLMNALKYADAAEREIRGSVPDHARISSIIEGTMIPATISIVKDRVKADTDIWFEQAQTKSPQIGAWAIINMERRVRQEMAKESKRRHQRMQVLLNSGDPDLDVSSLSSAVCDAVDIDSAVPDEDIFERIAFEFNAVYDALHIYETLNIPHVFTSQYSERRSTQATQCVQYQAPSDNSKLLSSISPYFAGVAGFFIIEDSIFKSGNQLMIRSSMSSLWEMAVSSIKVALLEQLTSTLSPSDMLELKHQIILFCRTMDTYSLNTTPLTIFMASHRDKYEEVLVNQFKSELEIVFAKEKFEPLQIDNAEDYNKLVVAYNLDASLPVNESKQFPLRVPFSASVPQICRFVKHYIADYFSFAASLPDMFALISRSIDELLSNSVNAKLNAILDDPHSLNVSQAVQVAVNADYLVMACNFFERFTMVFLDPKYYVKPVTLTARASFADTRTRGEDSIFDVIDKKIAEMLDLLTGTIDWCPQNPQTGPCDTVQMLVSFLETTMNCTQYMPASVRTAVHFASCRAISRIFVQLAHDAQHINVLGIYNLDQDVRFLEGYAIKTAIPNLQEAFIHLRQLIKLFTKPVEQLLDENIRRSEFSLVPPVKIAFYLDKLKEVPFLSVIPPEVPKIAKKNVEMVAKKLRHL